MKKHVRENKKFILLGLGVTAIAFTIFYQRFRKLRLSHIMPKEPEQIKKNIEKAFMNQGSVCTILAEKTITRNEQGIIFLIKVVQAQVIDYMLDKIINQRKDPFLFPFEEGIFVQKLGKTHNLLLNKYPMIANHVIITTNGFQPQESPNTILDLFYTYRVIQAMEGYGVFNSGIEAGASQAHKHLQVLPHAALMESDLLKLVTKFLKYAQQDSKLKKCYRLTIYKNINHFIRPIEEVEDIGSHLYQLYINLLKDLKSIPNQNLHYNLIMTSTFMMIVQRKQKQYENSISLNSMAFVGSLMVYNAQQLKLLEDTRLVQVLEKVCVMMPEQMNKQNDKSRKWEWI